VLSVQHSANQLVTESSSSPSAVLGKASFAECPTKGTRQSVRHSAKSRIPVVAPIIQLMWYVNIVEKYILHDDDDIG
jgi:hypothetical protein